MDPLVRGGHRPKPTSACPCIAVDRMVSFSKGPEAPSTQPTEESAVSPPTPSAGTTVITLAFLTTKPVNISMGRKNSNGAARAGRRAGTIRAAAASPLPIRGRPEVPSAVSAMDWAGNAACLHEEPEQFFPIGNSVPGTGPDRGGQGGVQPLPGDRRLPEIRLGKLDDRRRVGWPDRGRASRTQTPHRPPSAMSLKTPLCS